MRPGSSSTSPSSRRIDFRSLEEIFALRGSAIPVERAASGAIPLAPELDRSGEVIPFRRPPLAAPSVPNAP